MCSYIPQIKNGATNTLLRIAFPSFQRLMPSAAETPHLSMRVCSVPGLGHTRLDQGGLGGPIQKFYLMGLAESTHKLYACRICRFTVICSAVGLTVVPASEEVLCHFAATLAGGLLNPTCLVFITCTVPRGLGTPSPLVSMGCTMFYGV